MHRLYGVGAAIRPAIDALAALDTCHHAAGLPGKVTGRPCVASVMSIEAAVAAADRGRDVLMQPTWHRPSGRPVYTL